MSTHTLFHILLCMASSPSSPPVRPLSIFLPFFALREINIPRGGACQWGGGRRGRGNNSEHAGREGRRRRYPFPGGRKGNLIPSPFKMLWQLLLLLLFFSRFAFREEKMREKVKVKGLNNSSSSSYKAEPDGCSDAAAAEDRKNNTLLASFSPHSFTRGKNHQLYGQMQWFNWNYA